MNRLFVLSLMLWVVAVPEVAMSSPVPSDDTPDGITPEMIGKVLVDVKGCTGEQLDLSELSGKWKLAYFKFPMDDVATAEISSSADSLTGTVSSASMGKWAIDLVRPTADTPTFLITRGPPEGGVGQFSPVIVLAHKKDSYFATIQVPAKQMDKMNWGLYVKDGTQEPDEDALQRTTEVLKCLGISAQDDAPLLYPVNGDSSE